MKSIFAALISLLIFSENFAQAPQKISYQAIIRNSSGALVQNKLIGMKISLIQGSPVGTAMYIETQTPTSNINGMVSIEIGNGTPVSGNMNVIDWSVGPYFIKTETDPAGGSNYTIVSSNQFLSVPYAFHAKTAESSLQVPAGKFYPGQDTLGGIVFYVYLGADKKEHGFIVNKEESSGVWQSTGILTNATRSWDGADNTARMSNSAAATYVRSLTDGGFTDWYLPALDEFNLLYQNRYHVNKASNGNFPFICNTCSYWTSTEHFAGTALYFNTLTGSLGSDPKNTSHALRAIRAF